MFAVGSWFEEGRKKTNYIVCVHRNNRENFNIMICIEKNPSKFFKKLGMGGKD